MARAFQQVWKSITGMPARNLKDRRYTLVNFTSGEEIDTANPGGHAVGVLYEPNDVGQPAQVVASGFAFVYYGDTVQAGQPLAVGDNGKAVPATGDAVVVGIAAVNGEDGALGTIFLR